MISTRSRIAASAVARLMAVVVLPTPPFWFATVMIFGRVFMVSHSLLSVGGQALEITDLQNHAISPLRCTMLYQIVTPIDTALFDFAFVIPTFMEKRFRTGSKPGLSQFKQQRQWRERTRGYNVGCFNTVIGILNPYGMNCSWSLKPCQCDRQERSFLAITFN